MSQFDEVLTPKEMLQQFPRCMDIEYPRYEGTFYIDVFAYEWYNKSRTGAIVVYGTIYREHGYDNGLYEDAPWNEDDDHDVEIKFMVFNDPKVHKFNLSKQKDFDLAEHLADGLNYGLIVTFEKNSKGRIVPVHIEKGC